MLAKQPREEACVVIAHVIADGLDAFAGGREQALGGFYAQALQVVQGFVAGGQLKPAHKVADAHAVIARDVFEAELVGEVLFEPMLDLQDDHVLVQLLATKADTPRGVVALHLVKDVAGHGLGDIGAAKTLDHVDVKIAG